MKRILSVILFTTIILSSFITASANNGSINLLQNLSIMNGYEDGSLRLENTVSRAEFTKMIVSASKYKSYVATSIFVSPFIDVTHKHWAAPYILVALENKMISGYLDATFKPENTVSYEEAVTVVLKTLGYTDDDFGSSWPYGQIGIANQIGITKGLTCTVGQEMTRGDVATLIGNMLVAKTKDNTNYAETIGYKLSENVEIVSIDNSGNVFTNEGTFSTKYKIDNAFVGTKGTLVLNQQSETIGFVSEKTTSGSTQTYIVNTIVDDSIITYVDGVRNELRIPDSTVLYKDNTKTTFGEIKSSIQENDTLSIRYNEYGAIHYVTLNADNSSILTESSLTKYVLYTTLNDAVLAYNNGKLCQLALEDSTTTYKDNEKTTFGTAKANLKMGDILNVKYNDSNQISYVSVENGIFDGPKTVASQSWDTTFNIDLSSVSIIRNGVQCDKEEIQINDILYYSSDLNIIFAYCNTVTGVYQKATPNKDTPTSITLSGVEYSIESVTAFNKLSSSGKYNLGDSITLLLGKDGKVADVATQETSTSSSLVGYVAEIGTKEFTSNGKSTKEYYAKIVSADGTAVDYKMKTSSSYSKNSVVKVKFEDGYAKISKINNNTSLSGIFDYENKKIGSKLISSNVKILDVYSSNSSDATLYTSVYPQRIDGVTLSKDSILYYEEDDKGRITKLILKNVTGDMLKYGIMIKATNIADDYYLGGTYKYDLNGTEYELETTDKVYTSISSGMPIKVVCENDEVKTIQSLTKANGSIADLSYTSVKISGNSFPVSSNVCVYVRNYSGTYLTMNLGDLINNIGEYSVSAYYDKGAKSGGCIRVFVVTKK